MKIVELKVENVKRLKAVHIKPNGSLVVIGGKNGAGKSSVIDSIAYAIGGKALCPEVPVRIGENSAQVAVDLGELVVERSFTEKGSTLSVRNREGFKSPSPQSILDALVGKLSFDPLAFANMEPIKQRAILQELVGLNTADLDAKRTKLFQERAEAGRDVHGRETQIKSLPYYADAGMVESSLASLIADLERIQKHNAEVDALCEAVKREAQFHEDRLTDAELTRERIADLQKQLAGVETRLVKDESAVSDTAKRLAEARQLAERLTRLEERPIKEKIAGADEANKKVRANQARAQLQHQFEAAQAEFARLDSEIKSIDAEKANRLTAAKFPVPGLAFSETGVLMNGLPFAQASSAEQLRISVAMGLAMNTKLRVLLIRDGSLLDEDNLKLVAEMASAAAAQVWIERVGEGAECSVVIENGLVQKRPAATPRKKEGTDNGTAE